MPLDAVVYDAVISDEKEYDYIVTMQPTSPTLQVATLDSAIKYAIDNDFDTIISAINRPYLSWREEKGRKVPNYEKRLNRQYLPVNYVETGAFIISRRSVVTQNSRIGQKVDIYMKFRKMRRLILIHLSISALPVRFSVIKK